MIAIIVIKRKPVLTANTASKIKMWTVIQKEYMGANIKFFSLKPSHKEVTLKLKITDAENENISFVLNVTYYSLEPRAYDEAQEITLKGYISDFQDDVEPFDVDREDIKKLSRNQLESLLVKWMIECSKLRTEKSANKEEIRSLKSQIENPMNVCYGNKDEMTKAILKFEDQHQQDCIKINQLNVTIDTLADKYSRLRKTVGMD